MNSSLRFERSTSFGEAGVRDGEYDIETCGGDISIQVPLGLPARVEVLVNSGDVRSDIPLVTVRRPGARGSTQRLVGGTRMRATVSASTLRVRTDGGDVRPLRLSVRRHPRHRRHHTPPRPNPTRATGSRPLTNEKNVCRRFSMRLPAAASASRRRRSVLEALAKGS